MNLYDIQYILAKNQVAATDINPIIDSLTIDDLKKLSSAERLALIDIFNNMLILIKTSNSGAYLNDPSKAEMLLVELEKFFQK